MDYKEKAKRYDEAIERAKNTIEVNQTVPDIVECVESLFPELKESEDERIRKTLIDFFNRGAENGAQTNGVCDKDIIAWLERQDSYYTKRDVDDAYLKGVIDTKNEIEKQYKTNYQIRKDIATFIFNYKGDIKDRAKWMDYLGIEVSFVEKQDESNPYSGVSFEYNGHTWGMCARDGGVEIGIDSKLKAFVSLDKSFIYPIHHQPIIVPKSAMEATNEEKVDNANKVEPKDYNGIDPHFGKPINKVEPQPAWSEEDETFLAEIIDFFENGTVKLQHDLSLYASWLKSLKDRVDCELNCATTWKPSEEQVKALEYFVRSIGESGYASPYDNNTKLLYSLLEQIKKLREG